MRSRKLLLVMEHTVIETAATAAARWCAISAFQLR